MTRAHGILALVLAAALAWAYALTQAEWWPAQEAEQPKPVWTLDAKDITKVEWVDGGSRVVIAADPAARLSDGSPAWWIEASGPVAAQEVPPARPDAPAASSPHAPPGKAAERPAPAKGAKAGRGAKGGAPPSGAAAKTPPAAPASPAAPPPPPAPAPPRPIAFRGGLALGGLLRELARLTALRDLGRPDGKQRADFGLAGTPGTLRIERAHGEALTLDLGVYTFGGGTRYVRAGATGHAALVSSGPFRQIERVRRLMDREWCPVALNEAKRLDLKLGGRTLTLWQLDLPPNVAQRWARKPGAAQGDPALLPLLGALQGMKVLDYAQAAGEETKAASAGSGKDLTLEVTVTPGARKPAAAPVASAPAASAPGAPAPAAEPGAVPAPEPTVLRVFKPAGSGANAAQATVRAVSGYTRGPVELNAAAVQQVVDRARFLLQFK